MADGRGKFTYLDVNISEIEKGVDSRRLKISGGWLRRLEQVV
jgi:hypothetical protein